MGIIGDALYWMLKVLEIAIFFRVILSWVRLPEDNQFVKIVYQVTEPILLPIRSLMSRFMSGGGIPLDLSPLIAILLIQFLTSFIK